MSAAASHPRERKHTLLIAEEKSHVGQWLRETLKEQTGIRVYWVSAGREVLALARLITFDGLILGERLSDMKGWELYQRLAQMQPAASLPTLFLGWSVSSLETRERERVI